MKLELSWTILIAAATAVGGGAYEHLKFDDLQNENKQLHEQLKSKENELNHANDKNDELRKTIDDMANAPKGQDLLECQQHVAQLAKDQNGKLSEEIARIQHQVSWEDAALIQNSPIITADASGMHHGDYSDEYLRIKAQMDRDTADISMLRQKLACAQ